MEEKTIISKIGNYRLVKKLAKGGLGEIYLAEDLKFPSRKRVIKKLRKEFVYDKAFIRLLSSEAETLKNLKHQNIISVFDFVSEWEDHYSVLEWVDGYSLRHILESLEEMRQNKSVLFEHDPEKTYMPIPVAIGIVIQAADALAYLHSIKSPDGTSLDIVHADLHPRNILINKEGIIKLIDFSIAQTHESRAGQKEGVGRGIISYMSLEQLEGKALDSRSDIFSLGIILYEMLFGESPFAGNTPFEVYKNLKIKEIKRDTLPNIIEEELKSILVKTLEKNLKNRYQEAEELKKDCEGYLKKTEPKFTQKTIGDYLKSLHLKEEEHKY